MKWLPGGWQRADQVEHERATEPVRSRGTARYASGQAGSPDPATRVQPGGGHRPTLLGADAHDVDVSASSFKALLIGGGVSGLLTVLVAAALVNSGSSVFMWIWQLVFGVLFLWFITASRGMLNSRGFLIDRSGFYARTRGEVFGVSWDEIKAVGIGTLPWIQHRRPVAPERRQALELYPADPGFPTRHPELERWRVEESPSMPGLPGERYRFHLPPFSRLPKELEGAVQTVAPQKWVGHYKRHLPPPPA
ncbi:hypothetical protein [Saccharopolyspora phatthalungensis]|uniref:Uncharacterized protein n=1 Tax=Saccharopolyspora phatthalungensis TaxID=664693 RepID=A0A840Q4E0_9PSEU|nr:hypothetical protein [Saccharopolyspora phatthalungensis]MBB5155346.1 hypothetical protein [Saccharopolyspora phatthalungensis]